MKRKITVPASLLGKLDKLGIIPNKGKITDDDIAEWFNEGRKKSAPNDIAQWMNLVADKIYPNLEKYAAIIDVLAFPFDGQHEGRDCKGEFFHPGTDFMDRYLPYPPVVNNHGNDGDGVGHSKRTVVGETLRRWYDEQGGWAKIGVLKDTPYTGEILQSWKDGMLGISSYGLLKDIDSMIEGKIDVWLAGEISTILPSGGVMPCNWFAAAKSGSQKSDEEIKEILQEVEEPFKTRVQDLLDSTKLLGEDIPNSLNNNPVNPEGEGVDDDAEKVDFPEETEEIDMKPEEITALIATSVKEAVSEAMKAVPVTPSPELEKKVEPETDDNRLKSDARSLVASKAAESKAMAATTTEALSLTDGWINEGKVDPSDRDNVAISLSAAILQDERAKSGSRATAAFISFIEGGKSVKGNIKGLLGFDKNLDALKNLDEKVDAESIARMERAAGIT